MVVKKCLKNLQRLIYESGNACVLDQGCPEAPKATRFSFKILMSKRKKERRKNKRKKPKILMAKKERMTTKRTEKST